MMAGWYPECRSSNNPLQPTAKRNDPIVEEMRAYGREFAAIIDQYIGRALPIAVLRYKLHEIRGGTFVVKGNCPDNCDPAVCPHIGEPLNSAGVRERRTGTHVFERSKRVICCEFRRIIENAWFK